MQYPGGLVNVGLSCFLNAAAQALIHVLADSNHGSQTICNAQCLGCALRHLKGQLDLGLTLTPNKGLKLAVGRGFTQGVQHDAHELLMSAIGHCDWLKKRFVFTSAYIPKCLSCGRKGEYNHEEFLDLQIIPKSGADLQERVNAIFSPELLDDYECPDKKCKKVGTTSRTFSIIEHPEVMVVYVKKFSTSGRKLDVQSPYQQWLQVSKLSTPFKDDAYMLLYVLQVQQAKELSTPSPSGAPAPSLSVSDESVPSLSAPGESLPSPSAPGESVLSLSTPYESVPPLSAPDQSVPSPSAPGESVLSLSTPYESVPPLSAPDQSVPSPSAPGESILSLSTPYESGPPLSAPDQSGPPLSAPDQSVPPLSAPHDSGISLIESSVISLSSDSNDSADDVVFVSEGVKQEHVELSYRDQSRNPKRRLTSSTSSDSEDFSRSTCHGGIPGLHLAADIPHYKTSEAISTMLSCPEESVIKAGGLISEVKCNTVFVCEALTHKQRLDLRRDNMGVWKEGHRSTRMPYRDADSVSEHQANTYVWRANFICKSYQSLKKSEIYRAERLPDGSVGKLISPVVIVYRFEGIPVSFKVLPHGNAKTGRAFHPATKTLLEELKEASTEDIAPSKIYNRESLSRPIASAANLATVPRGVKQIQDLRHLTSKKSKVDIHQTLTMMMVNEENTSPSEKFIRRITTDSDNYSVCLYTENMLDFMVQKCATSDNSSPIHVDTTYKLTNMFALVCTMRALDFEGSPLVIGPILLTRRQRWRDFIVLWQELVADRRQLRNANLIFVTDGDEALIQSISDTFSSAQLFRCTLHLADNVKRRQREIGIPLNVFNAAEDLRAQLGFKANEFDKLSEELYAKWQKNATKENVIPAFKQFLKYYQRQVHRVLRDNIEEKVMASGLTPPVTNNSAESTNAMLKRWHAYKTSTVHELCSSLKEGILGQYQELEKGFMGISQKYMSSSLPGSQVQVTHKLNKLKDLLQESEVLEPVDGQEDGTGQSPHSKRIEELRTQFGSATPIPGNKEAGLKPGQTRGRKGKRSKKSTPTQAYTNIVSGGYVAIRRSNRQKICNGCKVQFISEKSILRHHCAMPYPYKNPNTGIIEMRLGDAANHHFHLRRWCVVRSQHHKDFTGHITIDPTLTVTAELKREIKLGELIIQY